MSYLSAFWLRSIFALTVVAVLPVLTLPAAADVERIEVLERTLLADGEPFGKVGPYEQLRGRLYFAISAGAPENQSIADIRLAARDARGNIHFTADFMLLRPVDPNRGNNRVLYEPANLGGTSMLAMFNDASAPYMPSASVEPGNGFLMEQGYTLLWTGWSWDITPGDGRLRADLPIATGGEDTIYGRIANEITVTETVNSARQFPPLSVGYSPLRPDDPDARLLVRGTPLGPRTAIPRAQWRFGREVDGQNVYDPAYVTLDSGFEPGTVYTVTYFARAPHVSGLGLAGIRDALLFFRTRRADDHNTPNPLLVSGGQFPQTILAVGSGQSAHALQTMVHFGLTADGRGRLAFNGALLSGIGGGRGDINTRFAQPARAPAANLDMDSASFLFPFAAANQDDPATGQTGSTLEQAGGVLPKLFYVNTSTDYWTRGASLTHTTADGNADLPAHPSTRLFTISGGHLKQTSGAERQDLSSCRSPLDDRPVMRALLVQLDAWVTLNADPAPSTIPSRTSMTLGDLDAYLEAFPTIPSARKPSHLFQPLRLNFGERFASQGIADVVPPQFGRAYTALVPIPNADGLDTGGIQLPDISVPLGTYTGWNLLNAATGAPERLSRKDGGFIPFPRTESERLANEDPRLSIQERYPSREKYREAYASAALMLAETGFLLGTDINPMVDRAGEFYDRIMTRRPDDESCLYLPPR